MSSQMTDARWRIRRGEARSGAEQSPRSAGTDEQKGRETASVLLHLSHLCILDDEVAGGEDQGDQRGREEHLDDGDIAVIAAEDLGEGVGVVYTESARGACRTKALADRSGAARARRGPSPAATDSRAGCGCIPTARQLWSWLNVMKLSAGAAMVAWRPEVGGVHARGGRRPEDRAEK